MGIEKINDAEGIVGQTDHLKEVQEYWNLRSHGFSDAINEELDSYLGQEWKERFSKLFGEGPLEILDDGMGAGFFTVILSSLGHHVTGIDYSDSMVEYTRGNLKARGLEAGVMQMDAQDLKFPDESFDAVADRLKEFSGVNMLCDIGNGTMNIMYINDGRPICNRCYTEKFGTHQCMLSAREALMRSLHVKVDDSIIEQVLRTSGADVDEKVVTIIRGTATDYVAGIMRSLREHEYNPMLMKLWFMGGGACLIRHFGQVDPQRVIILDDIHATAKGYQRLAAKALRKRGVDFEE